MTGNSESAAGGGKTTLAVAGEALAWTFLSIGLRLALLPPQEYLYIGYDGARFASMAREMAHGHFLDSLSAYWQPLYPSIIALFTLVMHNTELAAFTASAVFGGALVLPCFLFGNELFGRNRARFVAFLVLIHSALLTESQEVITEPVFSFFLTFALYVFWKAALKEKGGRLLFLAGLLSGLSYLTRAQGIVAAAVLAIMLLVEKRRRFSVRSTRVALLALGFFLAASPYLLYVRSATGTFTPSTTLAANAYLAEARAEGRESLAQLGLVNGRDRTFVDIYYFGKGDKDIDYHLPAFIARNPLRTLKRLLHEGARAYDFLPRFLPPVLFFLFCLGIAAAFYGGRAKRYATRLAFAVGGAHVLSYSAVYVLPRYVSPLVPFFLIFTSNGYWETVRFLELKSGRRHAMRGVVSLLCVLSLCQGVVRKSLSRINPVLYGAPSLEKEAGTWIKQNLSAGLNIMARKPGLAFYAEGIPVSLPIGDRWNSVKYAEKRNVDLVALATMDELDEINLPVGAGTGFLVMARATPLPENLVFLKSWRDAQGRRLSLYRFAK